MADIRYQMGAFFKMVYGKQWPLPEEIYSIDKAYFSVVPQGEVRDMNKAFALIKSAEGGKFGHKVDFRYYERKGYFEHEYHEAFYSDLAKKNANGFHVYFRFFKSNLFVFDDLRGEDIGELERNHITPNMLIKTSPGNYQGIIKLDDRVPHQNFERLRRARRRFCDEFGVDDSNIDYRSQPMRLPGFFNVSEHHFFENRFPKATISHLNMDTISVGMEKFF